MERLVYVQGTFCRIGESWQLGHKSQWALSVLLEQLVLTVYTESTNALHIRKRHSSQKHLNNDEYSVDTCRRRQ